MPDIRLNDVRKTYPNRTVGLYPTTLHISAGTYFVLLGPSGSGKTTLLRLIAGLESPDGGTIHFGERAVHELPPHERGIAFVPQRSALYPDRDVCGNIRIGLEFEQRRRPRRERLSAAAMDARVSEAAEQLQIGERLANRPQELSVGEQRRVMLARALVRRAEVWLLDEPLAQLDSALAAKLSQDLHLLQRQFGQTILQVTHDPIEAMALADRVGLLGGGRILQTGQPDEVYARPGSRTVGLHFGRPPMNLVDGVGNGSVFVAANEWLQIPCRIHGSVTLGIRPADIGFAPRDGFIRVAEGLVAGCQRVEDRFLVTVGDQIARLSGLTDERPSVKRLAIWLRVDQLHWFDGTTGNRIEV
jgi:ABC-type sugar transport system ATPase subunit